MRRHLFLLVPAAVIALFVVGALVSRSGGLGSGCSGFHFDRAAWAQGSDAAQTGRLSPRWRTADRLERCGTLTGRTKAATASLLGAPTNRSRARWLYPVGYELGNPAYMEVSFGADGRVRGVTSPS
jgi:hypothetical protein